LIASGVIFCSSLDEHITAEITIIALRLQRNRYAIAFMSYCNPLLPCMAVIDVGFSVFAAYRIISEGALQILKAA
jgi:hypothetical protein